jgi:hypothetical protein
MDEKVMSDYDLWIRWNDVPMALLYDYQPPEPRTRYYPGCLEDFTVYEVMVEGKKENLFIDIDDFAKSASHEIHELGLAEYHRLHSRN